MYSLTEGTFYVSNIICCINMHEEPLTPSTCFVETKVPVYVWQRVEIGNSPISHVIPSLGGTTSE